MAWYDGISSTISQAWDSAVDVAKTGISAKAEQSKEEYLNPEKKEAAPQPTTTAAPGVNWQKWGVYIGAAGIALAVYKLVTK